MLEGEAIAAFRASPHKAETPKSSYRYCRDTRKLVAFVTLTNATSGLGWSGNLVSAG